MNRDGAFSISFGSLFRDQLSGAGGSVYLSEKEYAEGVPEEIQDVKTELDLENIGG